MQELDIIFYEKMNICLIKLYGLSVFLIKNNVDFLA